MISLAGRRRYQHPRVVASPVLRVLTMALPRKVLRTSLTLLASADRARHAWFRRTRTCWRTHAEVDDASCGPWIKPIARAQMLFDPKDRRTTPAAQDGRGLAEESTYG